MSIKEHDKAHIQSLPHVRGQITPERARTAESSALHTFGSGSCRRYDGWCYASCGKSWGKDNARDITVQTGVLIHNWYVGGNC